MREDEARFFVQLIRIRGPFEISGDRIALLGQAFDVPF
jgi:hypothetical protein